MTDKIRIYSLKDAVDEFRRRTGFKQNHPLSYKKEEDEKSKWIATVFTDLATREQYAVTFKREWYGGFGRHFKDKGVPKGWGQASSRELVEHCIENGVRYLVAVMPNGRFYAIETQEFWDFYLTYETDIKHLKGEIACPAKMWERMKTPGEPS